MKTYGKFCFYISNSNPRMHKEQKKLVYCLCSKRRRFLGAQNINVTKSCLHNLYLWRKKRQKCFKNENLSRQKMTKSIILKVKKDKKTPKGQLLKKIESNMLNLSIALEINLFHYFKLRYENKVYTNMNLWLFT